MALRFAEHYVVFMVTHYGPMLKARERLTPEGRWEECRGEMSRRCSGATRRPTAACWCTPSTSSGRLADTTFIQWIATTGGRASSPATCTLATAGTREEIRTTADYVFWKAKRP